MNYLLQILLRIALLGLLLSAGCARQSMSRDEGGIVGSGTKIDCQQQPKHAACEQPVK